jgi:hypothetical protein
MEDIKYGKKIHQAKSFEVAFAMAIRTPIQMTEWHMTHPKKEWPAGMDSPFIQYTYENRSGYSWERRHEEGVYKIDVEVSKKAVMSIKVDTGSIRSYFESGFIENALVSLSPERHEAFELSFDLTGDEGITPEFPLPAGVFHQKFIDRHYGSPDIHKIGFGLWCLSDVCFKSADYFIHGGKSRPMFKFVLAKPLSHVLDTIAQTTGLDRRTLRLARGGTEDTSEDLSGIPEDTPLWAVTHLIETLCIDDTVRP